MTSKDLGRFVGLAAFAKNMVFVGIDSGSTGAVGFLCGPHHCVVDIPTFKVSRGKKKKTVFDNQAIVDLFDQLDRISSDRVIACLEEAQVGIPGKGNSAYNGFRVGCIAAGTPILTKRGWVKIECVLQSDLLWDGVEWVRHDGPVYQGEKACLRVDGIDMTSDHQVLTSRGWLDARTVAGLLQDGVPAGALLAAGNETEGEPAGQTGNMTSEDWTEDYSNASRKSLGMPSTGVTTQGRGTSLNTEDEVSRSGSRGGRISDGSSDTSPNFQAATTDFSRSTGSRTMRGTNREISGSVTGLNSRRIQGEPESWFTMAGECPLPSSWQSSVLISNTKLPGSDTPFTIGYSTELSKPRKVYDILNSGPRFRFQAGDMIVSNCNWAMWPLFLMSKRYVLLEPRPSVWKKEMKLVGTGKDTSLALAQKLFPKADLRLKKHHDRAEALLLASWARRQYKKENV
jgi:hypothetical protein